MTNYTAFLVQIWHANEAQRLRIVVKDAHSERQTTFTDFATLGDFISGNVVFPKENGTQKSEVRTDN